VTKIEKYFEYYNWPRQYSLPHYQALDCLFTTVFPGPHHRAHCHYATGHRRRCANILKQIARKSPDCRCSIWRCVLLRHDFEMQNYFFFNNWSDILVFTTIRSVYFHFGWNHTCTPCGLYYRVWTVRQGAVITAPTRTEFWQWIRLSRPDLPGICLRLFAGFRVNGLSTKVAKPRTEDGVAFASPAFLGHEGFGEPINKHLRTMWKNLCGHNHLFWGHEHNQVLFDKYKGVAGRCIGQGPFRWARWKISRLSFKMCRQKVALFGLFKQRLRHHGSQRPEA